MSPTDPGEDKAQAWGVSPPLGALWALSLLAVVTGLYLIFSHASPWVNPEQDVLYIGIGFVLLLSTARVATLGWTEIKRYSERRHGQLHYPYQPWMWRREWTRNRILPVDQNSGAQAWATCVAMLPVSVICVRFLVHDNRQGADVRWWLVGILGIQTILLLVALKATDRRKARGESYFQMVSLPGSIGEKVEGIVQTSTTFGGAAAFSVELACINRAISTSGGRQKIRDRIAWTEKRAGVLSSDLKGILVSFDVPAGLPESDDADERNQTFWYLKVTGDSSGTDYFAAFEIPVFT